MDKYECKDFLHKTYDKVRYGDTDKQGHVNNSVFATFLETGRAEILISEEKSLYNDENSFVIANLNVNFLEEILWPGEVLICTGIEKIGNSSIVIIQNIYQNDKLVANAKSIVVQIDVETKKSKALDLDAKKYLNKFLLK